MDTCMYYSCRCDLCRAAGSERRRRNYHQYGNKRDYTAYGRLTQYGVTPDDYDAMMVDQQGLCAICKQPETSRGAGSSVRSLCVDHDHSNGRARGLLCGRCNTALGMMRDDPSRLREAANYLETQRF